MRAQSSPGSCCTLLLFLLCCLPLLSVTAMADSSTLKLPTACQRLEIDANTNALMLLEAHDTTDSARLLQASQKTYPKVSQTCLRLHNASQQEQSIALYLKNPRAPHAELLQRMTDDSSEASSSGKNDSVTEMVAGLDYPLDTWKYLGGSLLFTVVLPPAAERTYELNIASVQPYFTQLQILPTDNARKQLGRQQRLAGILTGVIFSLAIYSFFIAVSQREKIYFYLVCSTVAVTLLQLSDLGILYPLWPQAVTWNQACSFVFAAISTIAGTALVRDYLITMDLMPRADLYLKSFLVYLLVVALPVALSANYPWIILLYALPTIVLMFCIIAFSIIRIRQGYTPAKLYLVAVMLPVMTGVITFLNYIGVLPSYPTMQLLPLAGTSLQLILFALALGERINWLHHQQQMVSEQTLAAQTETSAKKNFLARISHELRTPLSGIIGLSALARKNLAHDKEEPLIKGLEESARHLLDTTNMLLDHARIDAGKWPVNPTGFALREMLQDIIEQHRTAAGYKSLSINSAVQQNVPDHITTDQDIVRRILDYIINNAIKFTHDGGITVMAEASSNDPATATIRIDILDTGVGFDELFKARAFELFELADMSTTRNQQGFGLGLSLSKKLCELLGGEIGCDSNPRHGTVFWFTFPCRIDSRAAANTYKEQQRASSPASKTTDTSMARRVQRRREQQADQLLVAEDDEALQMIISAMLDKLHQHHTVFPHGKPLLSTYQRHPEKVAALLLDWNMPVCNAEETIAKIRRFETENRLDPVPVIIMSAYDRHSARELHLPDDISILQKPVTIDDLAYLLFPDEKNVP